MAVNCSHPDDKEVLLGKSIGIGLTSGFVCGGVFVSILFFVYRSSYIQNLIAERFGKKEPDSTRSKNKDMIACYAPNQPEEETQSYLTTKDVKEGKKGLNEKTGFRNKNRNADHASYPSFGENTGPYPNTDDQPTYENVKQMSNYESEYDYATPSTIQGWYFNELENTGEYVTMNSPQLYNE